MSKELKNSELERLRIEATRAIQTENIDLADEITTKILAYEPSPEVSYVASASMVDIGSIKNDSSLLSNGVNLMKKDLGKIARIPGYKPSLYTT